MCPNFSLCCWHRILQSFVLLALSVLWFLLSSIHPLSHPCFVSLHAQDFILQCHFLPNHFPIPFPMPSLLLCHICSHCPHPFVIDFFILSMPALLFLPSPFLTSTSLYPPPQDSLPLSFPLLPSLSFSFLPKVLATGPSLPVYIGINLLHHTATS